jgi:hypothetical protein
VSQQLEVKAPDVAPLKAQASVLVDRAKAMTVTSHAEYRAAGIFLVDVARLEKEVNELFEEPVKQAHSVHKFLTGLRGKLLEIPAAAKQLVKGKVAQFEIAEERRIREEQARREAEEKAKQENALQAEALQLEAAGEHEAAEQVISTPVVAPVIEIERARADGISSRKRYTFRVLDASKLDRKFLVPDEQKIRQLVNSLGLDAVSVLGEGSVEILEDRIVSVRA